jgi:hypothetical protein
MKKILQQILDFCYYARQHCVTSLAFFTLRVFGKEIAYSDVKAGTFESRNPSPLSLEEAKDVHTLLEMSRESFSNAEKRRTVVTDKCKTLLTLGSLLLGVIGLLLPKYLAFESAWMRGLSILAIAILFDAIVLLLVFFDVGQDMEVSLAQADIPLDETNLKKSLLNRHLRCTASSENRTDYLVEIYRAARFCFLSALTIVAGLVLASVTMNSPVDQTERIVREIRSDSSLINLLRGPQGNDGSKGDRGDQGVAGLRGDRGEEGERGSNADVNDAITRLLLDARFHEAIDNAIEKQNKKSPNP